MVFRPHTFRVINSERIINSAAVTIALDVLQVRIKATNPQPLSCSKGNLKMSLIATCMHIKLEKLITKKKH
jgi:hypothetical protein